MEAHQPDTKHKRGSGRDRVLDAYIDVLLTDGIAAATLDEVARRADISKGGLLHHFKSKDDLVEGLLERFVTANTVEVTTTLASEEGPILGYLNGSLVSGEQFSDLYMAVLRLAGSNDPRVEEALRASHEAWFNGLKQHIDDPTIARVIQLIGDGMYLHTLLGGKRTPRDDAAIAFAHRVAQENSN